MQFLSSTQHSQIPAALPHFQNPLEGQHFLQVLAGNLNVSLVFQPLHTEDYLDSPTPMKSPTPSPPY